MWRNEVAKDAEAVLREFPNGVPPTVYHQVALEISDCIPSPDGRNGLTEKMEIARLQAAIYMTAAEGTYDEIAVRKAVSFELAELIVAARKRVIDLRAHEQVQDQKP